MKIIFCSPPGAARELKLQSFDSVSKTTSGCSRKKITLNSLFSFYQYIFSIFSYFNRSIELSKAFGNPTLSNRIETKKTTFWYYVKKLDSNFDKLAEEILGKDDPLIARGFGKQGS